MKKSPKKIYRLHISKGKSHLIPVHKIANCTLSFLQNSEVTFQFWPHNHYNFHKYDWCNSYLIFYKLFCRIVIEQCNRTVEYNWTVKAVNHMKSTQSNPELIKVTIITFNHFPTKLGSFQSCWNFDSKQCFFWRCFRHCQFWLTSTVSCFISLEIEVVMIKW